LNCQGCRVQGVEFQDPADSGPMTRFHDRGRFSTILPAVSRSQQAFSALDNPLAPAHYRPAPAGAAAARDPMSATTEFKSYVSVAQRSALERLIFFNSCQDRVSDCIADAIEKFGAPEIVADRDRLRIHMKGMPDVQSLFALDAATGRRSTRRVKGVRRVELFYAESQRWRMPAKAMI
jgi:hypothetical protein